MAKAEGRCDVKGEIKRGLCMVKVKERQPFRTCHQWEPCQGVHFAFSDRITQNPQTRLSLLMHVWQVGITRLHGLIKYSKLYLRRRKIGESFCKNACRPPSLLHDLDYKILILVVDTFDPASGKSIIHDSVIFDWSGYKNDADRTCEANDKEFCSTPYSALVNQLFDSRAIFEELLENPVLQEVH